MQKVEILPLVLSDVPEALILENKYFSVPWSEKILIDTLNDESSYMICAKVNSNLVGYAGMYVAAGSEGYIYNIVVDEKFRNMKIATNMIENLINYSNKLSLEFLSLEVRMSNFAAICLYEKCGFKKCGIRKNFYDLPKENALIMTINFK